LIAVRFEAVDDDGATLDRDVEVDDAADGATVVGSEERGQLALGLGGASAQREGARRPHQEGRKLHVRESSWGT
jgi:hypothetical protein